MTEGLSPADILDIAAFGIVAVGLVLGLVRGLSGELARFAAFFGAFAAFRLAGPPWRGLCASWFGGSGFPFALAATLGTLAAAVLGGWLVRRLVDKGLRILVPQPLNAILGGLFGTASLFLLATALAFLLSLLPIDFVRDSLLAPSRFWKLAAPVVTLGNTSL